METNNVVTTPTKAGTLGGTLLVVFLHISTGELVKTAILAAIGAAVSFSVSFLLNLLVKKKQRQKNS